MVTTKKIKKDLELLLYITFSILILLLTAFNLQKIKSKKTTIVLGAETDSSFWEDFVIKHPTYIDGWVELGKMDKVNEIDPNYERS